MAGTTHSRCPRSPEGAHFCAGTGATPPSPKGRPTGPRPGESDRPAHIGFQITAEGSAPYHLTKLLLNPHETRAIDIRKLRDARRPDFQGNLIPAAATDGSVMWIRGDPSADGPVMGRLMQIHRKSGMASNYDCCYCGRPYNYTPPINKMNPISLYLWVASQGGMAFMAGYEDCNFSEYWYNYTTSASWTSWIPSIASIQGAGQVKGVSGGTATIDASYNGITWRFNGSVCIGTQVAGDGNGPGNVQPKITGISPAGGIVGGSTSVTISGSGFGASRGSSSVNAGSGITFTYGAWYDYAIVLSFDVSSNAPSGNHSVTVTTGAGTSNSVSFYVHVPYSATYISQDSAGTLSQSACAALGAPAGTAGYERWVLLQLQDSAGQGIPVPSIIMSDTITPPPGNALGMQTSTGFGSTDSSGEWLDHYYVCSTACPGSNAHVTASQSWSADSTNLGHVNTIVYSCTSITIDGH